MSGEVVLSVGRRRILDHLKLKGDATPGELASDLGLTPAAVRQHLDGLAAEDLVSVSDERTGSPGRPAVVGGSPDARTAFSPTAMAS